MYQTIVDASDVPALYNMLEPHQNKITICSTREMDKCFYYLYAAQLLKDGRYFGYYLSDEAIAAFRDALANGGWTQTSELNETHHEVWLRNYKDMHENDQNRANYYARHGGVSCPWCGSYDIDGDGTEYDEEGGVHENVECNWCGKTWIDEYKIIGIYKGDKMIDDPEHHFLIKG